MHALLLCFSVRVPDLLLQLDDLRLQGADRASRRLPKTGVSSRTVQLESAATHLKLHGEPLRNVLGLSRATLLGGKLRLEPADLRPLIQLITE